MAALLIVSTQPPTLRTDYGWCSKSASAFAFEDDGLGGESVLDSVQTDCGASFWCFLGFEAVAPTKAAPAEAEKIYAIIRRNEACHLSSRFRACGSGGCE